MDIKIINDAVSKLTGANAKGLTFAKELFAGLESFDFEAAQESGDKGALADFLAAAIKAETAELNARVEASDELIEALGSALNLTAGDITKENIAAKVSKKTDEKAVTIAAKAGIEIPVKETDGNNEPGKNELETFNAMDPADPARSEYYNKNKHKIFAIARSKSQTASAE